MINNYPVYVISKGRYENMLTPYALEKMDVLYSLVVEPQEFDFYAEKIDESKLIRTPFSNLGQGSTPVRNFVFERSKSLGYKRHWVLDDNILEFTRFNRNKKIRVFCPSIFKAAEDFVDRYKNIALAGFNYRTFAMQREGAFLPPFYKNTRIYSCILINNSIQHRWRLFYNEDTDLSLQVLKDGWCTVLFNAFLANKMQTQTMSGGNTDNVYNHTNNRKEFVEQLKEKHPRLVKTIWKYNRWHHQVDYSVFKQKLKRQPGLKLLNQVNEYGMKLKRAK